MAYGEPFYKRSPKN